MREFQGGKGRTPYPECKYKNPNFEKLSIEAMLKNALLRNQGHLKHKKKPRVFTQGFQNQ
jgi:hypothetical protein